MSGLPLSRDPLPAYFRRAQSLIGQAEIKGARHNNLIVGFWLLLSLPFRDDETPWCAGFVGACLEHVGIRSTRSGRARSYATYGLGLGSTDFRRGAIVVFERGPAHGHVGFLDSVSPDRKTLYVLGGNQGDRVCVAPIAAKRLIAMRAVPGVGLPVAPVITGASGKSVSEA